MANLLTPQNDYNLSNFVYKGEGNSYLIIAHLKDEVVIRFHKQFTKDDLPLDEGYSRVIREVHFAKKVLIKLLGHYVNVPEIAYFDTESVNTLIKFINPLRPSIRLSKGAFESFATKLPDYTLLSKKLYKNPSIYKNSVFCVEIKPKQGYVCEVDRKFPKCPFCLKQFQKKKTMKTKISNYCPLDLFSGNKTRMKKAILSLIENPQNNLKIFKNGICYYDQDSSQSDFYQLMRELFIYDYEELFSALLIKILLHPFCEKEYFKTKNILLNDKKISHDFEVHPRIEPSLANQIVKLLQETCKSCNYNCEKLPQGCVLDSILQIQKLHQHGDDMVYSIYEKYYDILCDNLMHTNVINTFENININKNHSKNNYDKNEYLFKSVNSQYFPQITSLQNEMMILQNYLLYCTAKDCSIMICFRKIDTCDVKVLDEMNVIELSNDHKYMVSVNISDTDLKSIQCIERHYKRDTDIMNAVISTLSKKLKNDRDTIDVI